jgi:hypothetical protein
LSKSKKSSNFMTLSPPSWFITYNTHLHKIWTPNLESWSLKVAQCTKDTQNFQTAQQQQVECNNNAKHWMTHMHCNVHKNTKLQNKTNYNEHEL